MNNLSLCLKVFSSKACKPRLSLSSAVSFETTLRMLSPCKICSIYWCKVPKIPFELPSPCSCSILVISFPFSWSNVRFIDCWLSKELTLNLIDFLLLYPIFSIHRSILTWIFLWFWIFFCFYLHSFCFWRSIIPRVVQYQANAYWGHVWNM